MKGLGLGLHSGVTPLLSMSEVFVTLTLDIKRPLGTTPRMASPYAQNVSQFHAVFFLGIFRKNNVITSLGGLASLLRGILMPPLMMFTLF